MAVCYAASIGLQDDSIEFSGPQGARWRAPLSIVRALGQFRSLTEDQGHFLAVIVDDSGAWLQAPCNAFGMDQLLAEISRRWRTSLILDAPQILAVQGRVLWPEQIRNAPLFEEGMDGGKLVLNEALRGL